jgi:hypothetical protein
MPANSVLAFIVPKLAIQAENAVSDCLFFILATYPKAAESFARYLAQTGVSLPSPIEYTTQVMWERGGGRPDMLGRSGDKPFLVVEAKFEAPLTDRQPVGYVSALPAKGGLLLFIAPAKKITWLMESLQRRCRTSRLPIDAFVHCGEGLTSASLCGVHRLAVASWEALIGALLHDLATAGDSAALADATQLSSLCTRLLSGELSLTPLAHPSDERDRALRKMVDSVVGNLVDAGHATTKGYRATPGPGYYKRYMRLSERMNWCVEFNSEYWARFGQSVIWLSNGFQWVSEGERAALNASLLSSRHSIRKQVLIPLLANHARSESEALEQMTTQALHVADVLAHTRPDTAAR